MWPLRAGTLLYTRAGITTLFAWLLWGDFVFTLMETVWPSVLPLKLHALAASDDTISLLVTTIPAAMNFVLNPLISTISDRHRGRYGRRIPFLLLAAPFVAVFLILTGFSKQLGAGLHQMLEGSRPGWLSEGEVIIGLICVLVVCFRFFELFINTVYWYLFNDVVPAVLLGRFLSLFRVVGGVAGALFNFFVYKYANSHSAEIFIGAGILYGAAFTLMCFNVKEGEYPPPEPIPPRQPWIISLKGFFQECFSHRIFILLYLSGAAWVFAGSAGPFQVFFATSIGLDLGQIGDINGWSILASLILAVPAGYLVDRFHPIRIMLVAKLGLWITAPLGLVFFFGHFDSGTSYWIYLAFSVINIPLSAAYVAAILPMCMRTLPRDRFGQFCSANAMTIALGMMAGGFVVGKFLGFLKASLNGSDHYYQLLPIWPTVFYTISIILTYALFREWKKLGGDSSYVPPVADAFARGEAAEKEAA